MPLIKRKIGQAKCCPREMPRVITPVEKKVMPIIDKTSLTLTGPLASSIRIAANPLQAMLVIC
jgi:hypothetical protein